jgi:thioredoxin-like negative regulator of GroEL
MLNADQDPVALSKYLGAGKPVFVFFHLQGCGPCEATMTPWGNMEKAIQQNGNEVVISKIESELIPQVKQSNGSTFQIKSFPSIRYVSPSGNIENYDGDRSAESLIEFVTSRSPSSSGKKRRRIGSTRRMKMRTGKQMGGRSRRSRRYRRRGSRRSRTYRKYF